MSIMEKTFPLRMDNSTYLRLQRQARRSCMSVTAYIRSAFINKLTQDEATDTVSKRRKK